MMPRIEWSKRVCQLLNCAAWLLIASAPHLHAQSSDALRAGFTDPPRQARPLTWWHWVNGCVSKGGITADLESMQRVGLGGAQIFSVYLNMTDTDGKKVEGPVRFMSPEWRELIRHALAEAKRLGLELSIMQSEGWGQAGGQHVPPAESMQKVVWSETRIRGGRTIQLDVPKPETQLDTYKEIALLAFPTAPGDEVTSAPVVTSSNAAAAPLRFSDPGTPTITLPLPMPDAPQWVRLEFESEQRFSSLEIRMKRMRDTGDPEQWEGSAFLDDASQKLLAKLPGPHRWELQVSDDGKQFRSIAPIYTHGTTVLPEVRGRIFRIWMPVPPPVAESLPLARSEKIEITGISFGGPRIDRPEARTGKIISARAREFSGDAGTTASGIAREQMVTLTGRHTWDAPAGNWTLLRIGATPTAAHLAAVREGGLECDKLSRAAVEHHARRGVFGAVVGESPEHAGATLTNILCDSWETGYETWTPLMREEFQQRRGYALEPWLPALAGHVVESAEASERFLWDFRRTLADLVAEHYYGTLQSVAHENKMGLYAEAAGHGLPGVVDQLMNKGRTDVPMGEFWVGRRDTADTKEAASAAHAYGKPLAASESFTCMPEFGAWTRDPQRLKAEGDLQYCMGINRFCFHRFAHQPDLDRVPGMTMGPAGSEFERTNTWWEPGRAWIQYLSRCQFLLQRGGFVADVCYFYGEDAPVGLEYGRLPQLPAGYDFDAINAELLLQLKVRDGRLVLPSGMEYRVLILPERERMTPRVARAVRELVQAGATVVGPRPLRSPSLASYPECDRELAAIADEVWGDCDGKAVKEHSFGAGRVVWGKPMAEVLAQRLGAMPDFGSDDPELKYIHRREGASEIYFISNQSTRAGVRSCTFRVAGLQPELWHPDRGRIETVAMYGANEGRITLPIYFEGEGAIFVVFREPAQAVPITKVEHGDAILFALDAGHQTSEGLPRLPQFIEGKLSLMVEKAGEYRFTDAAGKTTTAVAGAMPEPIKLSGPWRLDFPPQRGAPARATFDQLIDWTAAPEPGIRYFSGTATYTKTFELPADYAQSKLHCELDLGVVHNLAEVSLNGHELGIVWKTPFQVDITPALKPGSNQLTIKVTNLWPNRLIGDQSKPVGERVTWTSFSPYRAYSPLLPSGLLGPVEVRPYRLIRCGGGPAHGHAAVPAAGG